MQGPQTKIDRDRKARGMNRTRSMERAVLQVVRDSVSDGIGAIRRLCRFIEGPGALEGDCFMWEA